MQDASTSRLLYGVGSFFFVVAFLLRAAVATPIQFIHNALAPWFILELPFIFVGAFIWTFLMSKSRVLLSLIVATAVVVAYFVITTGIGFV